MANSQNPKIGNSMKQPKCDNCGSEDDFLNSPFNDAFYGKFCDVCIDGQEGDIIESEEFASYQDDDY